jgi:hypothetical protein
MRLISRRSASRERAGDPRYPGHISTTKGTTMSESDIEKIELRRMPCDNNVYADTFESKLDPKFTSKVATHQVGWKSYEVVEQTDKANKRRMTVDDYLDFCLSQPARR